MIQSPDQSNQSNNKEPPWPPDRAPPRRPLECIRPAGRRSPPVAAAAGVASRLGKLRREGQIEHALRYPNNLSWAPTGAKRGTSGRVHRSICPVGLRPVTQVPWLGG
jgi:hypothetical protein